MNREKSACQTPILLMLFNRPRTTRALFERLREIKPAKLFIAANGPRASTPADIASCRAVQEIFSEIDWECEVHRNFREENIGMQRHWVAALDWFFESVESGIVLEDDCIPSDSFFCLCADLLSKYESEDKVMHINGSNFQFGKKRGDASYYFSKYPHTWGWATWKRAWKKYDDSLSSFPAFERDKLIESAVSGDKQQKYWMNFFEGIRSGRYYGSDIKWIYSIWANRGACITPNVNMVTNIGHGMDAGHTVFKEKTMGQERIEIGEIIHPSSREIICDKEADLLTFRNYFYKSFFQKAFYKVSFGVLGFFR